MRLISTSFGVALIIAQAGCHGATLSANGMPDRGAPDAAVGGGDDAADAGSDGSGGDAALGDGGSVAACATRFGAGVKSQWGFYDASGKLTYKPLDGRGD